MMPALVATASAGSDTDSSRLLALCDPKIFKPL